MGAHTNNQHIQVNSIVLSSIFDEFSPEFANAERTVASRARAKNVRKETLVID